MINSGGGGGLVLTLGVFVRGGGGGGGGGLIQWAAKWTTRSPKGGWFAKTWDHEVDP